MRVEAWRENSGGPGQAGGRRAIARRRLGIGAIPALGADTPISGSILPNRPAPERRRADAVPLGPGPTFDPTLDTASGTRRPERPPVPLSPLELMAAALGVGVATAEELAAGAGRLVRVDRPDGEAVTLIAVGHDERGPILAVPANPARLGDLAQILAVEPSSARRIRLADPGAFAAALAAAASATEATSLATADLFGGGDRADWVDDDPSSVPFGAEDPTAPADALRRPALRVVGPPRVAAALAAFRLAAGGCGAERTVTRRQAIVLGISAAVWTAAAAAAPATVIGLTVCLAAICFVGLAALRVAAAASGVGGGFEPPAASLVDADLPVYTVLVPLHREARVVPRLLPALCALDYPALCIKRTKALGQCAARLKSPEAKPMRQAARAPCLEGQSHARY